MERCVSCQEQLLFDPAPANERCLFWVQRSGGSSGRAEALVRYMRDGCGDEWPVDVSGTHQVDWGALDGIVVWEDGDLDSKCAVERFSLRNHSSQKSAVLIYSDGKAEPREGVCGFLTSRGAATIVGGMLRFSIRIMDRGKTGGGNLTCIKGDPCMLDLSLTIVTALLDQEGNSTFLQDVSHGVNCLPCSIGINRSSHWSLSSSYHSPKAKVNGESLPCQQRADLRNAPLRQFSVEGVLAESAKADLGDSLRGDTPGDRSICFCREGWPDDATYQVATLSLLGPYGDNFGGCFKSRDVCEIILRGVGFQSGQHHLRIMTSCGEQALTPQGFVDGALAVGDEQGTFLMAITSTMRRENVGIYQLCWCHSAVKNCSSLEEFDVSAGTFIYGGPYTTPNRSLRLGTDLWVLVAGIGVTPEDHAWLMKTCGEESQGALEVSLEMSWRCLAEVYVVMS